MPITIVLSNGSSNWKTSFLKIQSINQSINLLVEPGTNISKDEAQSVETTRHTRMVQLPATAAIEYVAAGLLAGGLMLVPPSSMRIRTV